MMPNILEAVFMEPGSISTPFLGFVIGLLKFCNCMLNFCHLQPNYKYTVFAMDARLG